MKVGQVGRTARTAHTTAAQIVNLLHVHLQVVRAFEHLAARLAGVGNEAALVLVAHVAQQRALQVEDAGAERALKLGPLRGLTHGVHSVGVGDAFEAAVVVVAVG